MATLVLFTSLNTFPHVLESEVKVSSHAGVDSHCIYFLFFFFHNEVLCGPQKEA